MEFDKDVKWLTDEELAKMSANLKGFDPNDPKNHVSDEEFAKFSKDTTNDGEGQIMTFFHH